MASINNWLQHSLVTSAVLSGLWIGDARAADDVLPYDGYGNDFLNYKPLVIPAKPTPKKTTAMVQIAPSSTKQKEQKVTVGWLRDNYGLLEERAIDEPTKDNVSAHLYTRRIVVDKAQRFAEMAMEITRTDPLINENNRVPYASMGALSIRNADFLAQRKAVEELAQTGGLLVFIDSSCRFCAMQLPILASLKNNYHMDALIVSIDGAAPKDYKGSFVKDTGLFKKLALRLTPSIVFVNKPKAYVGSGDPNTYHVIAQGFYAQDELVKQIAYAGFRSELLSADVRKDLNVWNRGVATTKDMEQLTLDVNDPASFKEKIAPILQKQYKE